MAKKLNNELRSKLTEYQNNYKLCNLNLISCYTGLYPASLTKLSMVIFNQILNNKMYHKKDSKFYDPDEEKRIFTSIPVTPITLLENCHPVKYRAEKKDASKDVGNIVKRIYELDDNNIFYVWRCGYPKNYMFVLERDIGSWKPYNPLGVVTPKTVRKILHSTKGMCNNMFKMLQENGEDVTIHEVRVSFCKFVSRIVEKMHPDINANLDRWEEGRGYREYLVSLNEKIGKLRPYDGLQEDDNFYERLPLDVFQKLTPKKSNRKSHSDLSGDLLPKNEDLTTPKKPRRKSTPKVVKEAKFDTFKSLEPLKDANSFYRYYKSVINSASQDGGEFHEVKTQVGTAAEILDQLKESGYDEAFLLSWVGFYYENHLKGNRIKRKDMTSLKKFKETFSDYSGRYIGCGV